MTALSLTVIAERQRGFSQINGTDHEAGAEAVLERLKASDVSADRLLAAEERGRLLDGNDDEAVRVLDAAERVGLDAAGVGDLEDPCLSFSVVPT